MRAPTCYNFSWEPDVLYEDYRKRLNFGHHLGILTTGLAHEVIQEFRWPHKPDHESGRVFVFLGPTFKAEILDPVT